MKILDERGVIISVFEKYADWHDERKALTPSEREFLKALDSLNPQTVTWGELQPLLAMYKRQIVPHTVFAHLCSCDECGTQNVPTVLFCENADIEERMAYICADCLEKALKALRGATNTEMPTG